MIATNGEKGCDNSNYSPKLPKNSSRRRKHQVGPLLWGWRNTWDKHGSRQVVTQLRQFGQSFGRDFENRIVQLICVAAVCENTRKRTRTSPKPKTAVVDSTWSANTFGQQAQPWFCVGNPGQCTRFLEGPRRAHAFNLGAFQCTFIYKSLLNARRPHHIGRGEQRSQPGRLAFDSRLARCLF